MLGAPSGITPKPQGSGEPCRELSLEMELGLLCSAQWQLLPLTLYLHLYLL